jgi:type II secretory pathway pseudopilin PulG
MALAKFKFSSQKGFSILEVTIATGIMAGALVTLGQMFAVSVSNNRAARSVSYTTVLAEQKMEQLRGLTWGFDNLGLPMSDTTTNTALPTETATGGTGLSPSPRNTLTRNTAGWVDYVDQFGNILGGGDTPVPNTVYIRRWAVEPLPTNPNNTLIFHVLVTKRPNRGSADTDGSTLRLPDEARLVSVKTRKAQ